MMRIVNELESVGDSCYNLILLCGDDASRRTSPSTTRPLMKSFPSPIRFRNFLTFIKDHMNEHMDKESLKEAYDMESRIDKHPQDPEEGSTEKP